MPLFLQKNLGSGCTLAVWHIQESKDQLINLLGYTLYEESKSKRINGAKPLHYLASRVILTQLFKSQEITLRKDINNKPSLWVNNMEWAISITHSYDFAAIIISPIGMLGIDIEKINERINRVKHKFLNQIELEFAGADDKTEEQTLIWSAKETLYKIYSLKEVDFIKNLLFKPFSLNLQGQIEGTIDIDAYKQECTIHYLKIQNYYLTYYFKP